jgi:hypothetical protein
VVMPWPPANGSLIFRKKVSRSRKCDTVFLLIGRA